MNLRRLNTIAVLVAIILFIASPSDAQTEGSAKAEIPAGSGYHRTYVGTHTDSTGAGDLGVHTININREGTITYQDGWTVVESKNDSGETVVTTRNADGRMMEERSYDANNNVTASYIKSGLDEDIYVYGPNKQVTSHIHEHRTYDDRGRITSNTTEFYDSSGKLESRSKSEYNYADENDITGTRTSSTYDPKQDKFVKTSSESSPEKPPARNFIELKFPDVLPDLKDEPGYKSKTSSDSGLDKTSFTLPGGSSITVNLPTDIAVGDTIVGTVQATPTGQTEAEQAKNLGELNGTVSIEVGGRQTKLTDKTFTFIIHAIPTAEEQLVSLFVNGKRKATTELPIAPAPTYIPTHTTLPTIAQQGRPIQIRRSGSGAFASGNSVTMGGTQLPVLAANPRQLIVLNTNKTVGPSEIEYKQGGSITQGPISNIGVVLSAGKLHLLRDETTFLTIKISGLSPGVKKEVLYDLVLATPGIISMSGGDVQHGTIATSQVQADGTYTTQRTLTGITPGSFNITCAVRSLPMSNSSDTGKTRTNGATGPSTGTAQIGQNDDEKKEESSTPTKTPNKDVSDFLRAYVTGQDLKLIVALLEENPQAYEDVKNWLTAQKDAKEQHAKTHKAVYDADRAKKRANVANEAAAKAEPQQEGKLLRAAEQARKLADAAQRQADSEIQKEAEANKALKEAESKVDPQIRTIIEKDEADAPKQEKVDESTLPPKKPENE